MNSTPISKKALTKKGRSESKPAIPRQKESKLASIDQAEIQRRKEADKCLWCAWPWDRQGAHHVKTCVRPLNATEGTALFPKAKQYQQQPTIQEISSAVDSSETSSDDSL
jgi:hypothetical protein